MLLWFADLMNVTEEVTIHRPNVSTLLSSAFIRHSLMLHWFADLMNVTEDVIIHRPNVSTLLSSAFIRDDLNAATRGPFI